MMNYTKEDVTFTSEGLNCKGWLHVPEGDEQSEKPAIVMARGLNAVAFVYHLLYFHSNLCPLILLHGK